MVCLPFGRCLPLVFLKPFLFGVFKWLLESCFDGFLVMFLRFGGPFQVVSRVLREISCS